MRWSFCHCAVKHGIIFSCLVFATLRVYKLLGTTFSFPFKIDNYCARVSATVNARTSTTEVADRHLGRCTYTPFEQPIDEWPVISKRARTTPKLDEFPNQSRDRVHATAFHELNVFKSIILIKISRRVGLLVVFIIHLGIQPWHRNNTNNRSEPNSVWSRRSLCVLFLHVVRRVKYTCLKFTRRRVGNEIMDVWKSVKRKPVLGEGERGQERSAFGYVHKYMLRGLTRTYMQQFIIFSNFFLFFLSTR